MDLEQTRTSVAEARERATERWARLSGASTCRLDGPDQQRLAAKEAEGAVQALRLAGRHLSADGDAAALVQAAREEWQRAPAGLGPAAEAYLAGGLAALDRLTDA